jgi:DNA topoisomerase-1
LKLVGGGAQGKYTTEELVVIDLEEVKKMILIQEPKAFDKKTKAAPKKAVASKTAVKKAPAKKK